MNQKFNLQVFGRDFPPLYSVTECLEDIEKIADIDVKINELMIQRELYVKDLKEKIKKTNKTKN